MIPVAKLKRMSTLSVLAGVASVYIAACSAPAPATKRALPSDFQGTALHIVPAPNGDFLLNGARISCDELASVARLRRPSMIAVGDIGSIAHAFCVGNIANELKIPAGTMDADGTIHSIKLVH